MTRNTSIACGGAGLFALCGIAASVIAYFQSKKNDEKVKKMEEKLDDIAKKLDKAIDNIAESTDVEISEAIVKKAVDAAVEKEANRQVSTTTKVAIAEIKAEMCGNIRREINGAYSDIKEQVNKEVMKQVGELDIHDIRRDIIDGSKRDIKDKLDSEIKDATNRIDDARREAEKKFDEIVDDAEEKIDDAVEDLKKHAKDKMENLINQNSERVSFMNDFYSDLRGRMK